MMELRDRRTLSIALGAQPLLIQIYLQIQAMFYFLRPVSQVVAVQQHGECRSSHRGIYTVDLEDFTVSPSPPGILGARVGVTRATSTCLMPTSPILNWPRTVAPGWTTV